MSNLYQPPLVPGAMAHAAYAGQGSHAVTKNPYFTVASQFLPRNLHDVIRWARFIAIKSPVTTEVIRKLATYPITSFTYSSESPAVKAKYEEIIKSFSLRRSLHDIGFQYHTIGNVFISIYMPFVRTFKCPSPICATTYGADKADFLKWEGWQFKGKCPKCNQTGIFTRYETKSNDIKQMNLIRWDPTHIVVNHNPISGKSEYYYTIPNEIKTKIRSGDRLYLNSTPWEFVEAVKNGQDFKFEDDHIFHLRNVDMGFSINGISVPPLITHFDLVFYQATLRKANESIATDFMSPMRVVFPQAQTGNSDPVVTLSMRNFTMHMEQAFVRHKQDNNHILVAPVPVGYQSISGEGKTLLVNAEIAQAEESLLLSLGVSRELLSGTTNWTSSTVGLRMLKNTLDSYITQIQELMDWVFAKCSVYLNLEPCQVGLTPFQLTDDESLKNFLAALINTGKISMTTIYEALGRDYKEEQIRLRNDAVNESANAIRTQFEIEQANYLAGLRVNEITKKDDSYITALQQAQQLANELMQADPGTQSMVMQQLKMQDFAKYLLVSKLIDEAIQSGSLPGSTPQGGEEEGSAPPGAGGPPGASPAGPVGMPGGQAEQGEQMGPASKPNIPGLRSPVMIPSAAIAAATPPEPEASGGSKPAAKKPAAKKPASKGKE